MSIRSFTPLIASVLFTPVLLFSVHIAGAQVMTSSNYQIQSDSVNVGGGLSSSTNYSLESSAGEIATGQSDSTSYSLRAGYQQMQEVYIAVSSASSSLTLSPSIGGVTGGTSNGSTTVTVTTDSISGYQLTIEAEGNPAMQNGAETIADYTPAGVPDYTFTTGSGDAHFGYTPEGADVVQRFLNSGVTCNSGSSNAASACWDGLSTTAVAIASATGSNHPTGTETSVRFRVGVGSSVVQATGVYTATTTLTALSL
ncbi:MAG: hypothetical protein ACI92I_000240 [Acidimicrobiales bacterium]|jgi:hypothetical protein